MKSFRRLLTILSAKRPPLRTRGWIMVVSLIMATMMLAYSYYVDRATFTLYEQLRTQELKAARAELSAAVEKTMRALNKQAEQLITWQELQAQFQDPSYYFYWREQSLPTSPYYGRSLKEVELYGPDGKRLAGIGATLHHLDPVVPPLKILWQTDGKHLYLLRYYPVRDDRGRLLGYAGMAFDFLEALRQRNTFKHIKPEQILVQGNGRFPADQIRMLLSVAPQPDPIAETLMGRFRQVMEVLLILVGVLIAFIWVTQYVLQMRSYNVILNTLKQVHQADRPLPLPAWPLPIRELNQLLRLIIRLQHHWLHQRTKREALVGELQRIAYEDPLTGLPNRNALIRELEQFTLRPPFTFVLLDIANFRAFNDTYGADTGDALLKRIAELLAKSISDLSDARVYRVGSDEFVLIFPDLPKETVKARVEALIRKIEALTLESLTGHFSHIHARAGLVHVPALITFEDTPDGYQGSNAFSSCMMQADAALLHAKKHRQALVDFDTLENVRAPLLDHRLGEFIDHAVRTGEGLLLYAQPIVDPNTRHVLYHELLVRAQAPQGRLIQPAELFEWIDRHHLHRELDRQVIRLASDLLASGAVPEGQGISLNLCEQTLLAEENLLALLAPLQIHIPRHTVTIEVLESVLMKQLDAVRDQLARLRPQGFKVALDDFGSGYASFRYLAQLPVDTVKLDRSLLSMLHSPVERERELFEQLCHMLSEAEFAVIVEGVETADQCQRLRTLPVAGLQGFFFSPPQPEPVTRVEVACPPSSP